MTSIIRENLKGQNLLGCVGRRGRRSIQGSAWILCSIRIVEMKIAVAKSQLDRVEERWCPCRSVLSE